MKKRFLTLLLCTTFTLSCLTSCGYTKMERPEGGWTVEEILSVTYVCDKPLSYPLTFSTFGEEFSMADPVPSGFADVITMNLLYNDKRIGYMKYMGINDMENWNNELQICDLLVGGIRKEIDDPIVVNGIHLGDSKKKLVNVFGQPDEIGETGNYRYNLKNSDSQVAFAFDTDDTISYIKFDDLC